MKLIVHYEEWKIKRASNLGNGAIHQPPLSVEAHNQVQVYLDNALRWQPPTPRPQDYYRGNINIAESDEPRVLPPLPPRHTFLVMSSLMQILIVRGLFSGLPSEDPHAQIAKLRSVRKSCVGRTDFDMNVIGL